MGNDNKVTTIDARDYFAALTQGLRWYNYEDLKKLVDFRQTTTDIGHVPIRLAVLLAEDAEEMGLAASKSERLSGKSLNKSTLH